MHENEEMSLPYSMLNELFARYQSFRLSTNVSSNKTRGGTRVGRSVGNGVLVIIVAVGAGSVVVKPVPDNSTVVGIPGRVVRSGADSKCDDLEHGKLPDPEGQAIESLSRRLEELEEMVRMLAAEKVARR